MLPPSLRYILSNGQHIAYIHHSHNPIKKSYNDIEHHNNNNTKIDDGLGIFFLPGFQSKMRSTKSKALYQYCRQRNLEFTTLDYFAHGESSHGPCDFVHNNKNEDYTTSSSGVYDVDIQMDPNSNENQGTISRYIHDALHILENITQSPNQILIGSSMGSWIMILIALSLSSVAAQTSKKHIKGMIGIASAPDFTNTLLLPLIQSNPQLQTQLIMDIVICLQTMIMIKGYIHTEYLRN